MKPGWTAAVVAGAVFLAVAGAEAQRAWVGGSKPVARPGRVTSGIAAPIRPRAEIGGAADGIHCTAPTDNGVGVHNLGFIPPGFSVTITVESFSEGFDPVAAVLVATLGASAGNDVRTATFYDDNSGGDNDPTVKFVAPTAGTYLLLVNDREDKVVGCYRYQVVIG